MKSFVLALLPVALLALAACGSPTDASKSNFMKAIDAHLATHCQTIEPDWVHTWQGYPRNVELADPGPYRSQAAADRINSKLEAPFEVLVRAGLLSAANGTAEASGYTIQASGSFLSHPKVHVRTYSLTAAGKKALTKDPDGLGGLGFCAVRYKVDEIVRFTQPAANMAGVINSQVVYTYSPAEIAPWATSPEVIRAFPQLKGFFAKHQQAVTTLVLTNDSWVQAATPVI